MKRLALVVIASCAAETPAHRTITEPVSLHTLLVMQSDQYTVSLAPDGAVTFGGAAQPALAVDEVRDVEDLLAAAHLTPGMRCRDRHGRVIWYVDPDALPIAGVDRGCAPDVDLSRLGSQLEGKLHLRRWLTPMVM